MKVNSVSHYSSRNNSKSFGARIPKIDEVCQAFGVAEAFLASGRRSDCKKVGEFCSALHSILKYKPSEDLILKCNKTLYSSSFPTGGEINSKSLFTYYFCSANILDEEVSVGARIWENKTENYERAKLCFDTLKAFGDKIVKGLPRQRNLCGDLKNELENLKNIILV